MDTLHSGTLLVVAALRSPRCGSRLEGRWISGTGDVDYTDAIGVAKERGKKEVVTLLERFKSDAAKTRSEVRKELGITGQYHSFFSID